MPVSPEAVLWLTVQLAIVARGAEHARKFKVLAVVSC